jgi:hypothetical protein
MREHRIKPCQGRIGSFGRIDGDEKRESGVCSREKGEENPNSKPRERRLMRNAIFWCLNQINIPSRTITKLPLP